MLVFILVQISLFFIMTFHDWVHVPPFTDIREIEKVSSWWGRFFNSLLFALLILVPLGITLYYKPTIPFWPAIYLVTNYGVLTLGTICSWWIPYFFGSADWHKEAFAEYKGTHTILPSRGDNVVPNTLHIILHLHVWFCFGYSVMLLLKRL